jgi:hypothetical protein
MLSMRTPRKMNTKGSSEDAHTTYTNDDEHCGWGEDTNTTKANDDEHCGWGEDTNTT